MKRISLCSVLLCLLLCLLAACQKAPESGSAPSPHSASASISKPEAIPHLESESETKPESKPKPGPQPEPKPKPAGNTLYVLMYHDILPDNATSHNDFMVTVSHLREDLTWLLDNGYTPVLPSELAAGLRPSKPVLITFDDGYLSNYTLALPLLQELNVKCEIALITHHIEDGTPGFLTWDMCREMAATGLVEFGSHTHDLHTISSEPNGPKGIKRMPDETQEAYSARLTADLQTSINLIQDNIGTAPILMAHPFGFTDTWASGILKENFSITVTSKTGPGKLSKGLYYLPRYNVTMEKPVSSILP